jgi:hypothetical protein
MVVWLLDCGRGAKAFPQSSTFSLSGREAQNLSEGKHGPGRDEDDHCEQSELRSDTGPLALRVTLTEKANYASAQGGCLIKQPSVPTIAA